MLNYAEAVQKIREVARQRNPLDSEVIPIQDCIGRIAAEDILSPLTVPPFDNSAMDGFAVHSRDFEFASDESPVRVNVLGVIAAGDAPLTDPAQSGAWEIMTGAPMPAGFDAVVKIEDVNVERGDLSSTVEIRAPLNQRMNLRKAGEDFAIGSLVLRKGTQLAPDHLMALASLGISELRVLKRLKVGVLSTGREIVPVTSQLEAGQIYNSTAPFLLSALRLNGVDAIHLGTIHDEPEDFARTMRVALKENFDVILTTGAVSMGKFDFVTEGIRALGAKTHFHIVAIRPGKPLLFAEFEGGPVFFGLPGNPVSGVVGLRFFFDPFLRAMQGQKPERTIRARLKESVTKPEGLRCFFKAGIGSGPDAQIEATVLAGQMSFMVSSLLQATAWAILPEAGSKLAAGDLIEILPMYYSPYDWHHWHSPASVKASQTPHQKGCC